MNRTILNKAINILEVIEEAEEILEDMDYILKNNVESNERPGYGRINGTLSMSDSTSKWRGISMKKAEVDQYAIDRKQQAELAIIQANNLLDAL